VAWVRVETVGPERVGDADVAGVAAVYGAALAVDAPGAPGRSGAEVEVRLRGVRAGRRRAHVLARDGADLVGYATVTLSDVDNPHLGHVEVVVRPGARGRGLGRALLRAAAGVAAADGRAVLFGETKGPAGDRFCAGLGLTPAQEVRASALRFADADWAGLGALAAADHPGYRLVPCAGSVPEELLGPYAVAKAAMNDAPADGVAFTGSAYTPDSVREEWAAWARLGEPRVALAVHGPTGAVAGFSEVVVPHADPAVADQEDTAVVPAHRGRGLGLWVKAALLVRLRADRPEVEEVGTHNAASNRPMLAVNDRLGFRLRSVSRNWQAPVAALR
jgi:mycothiol synthase